MVALIAARTAGASSVAVAFWKLRTGTKPVVSTAAAMSAGHCPTASRARTGGGRVGSCGVLPVLFSLEPSIATILARFVIGPAEVLQSM